MSTKMKNSSPSKADLQVHVEDELDSIHQTLAANDDLQELVEGGGSTDGGGVGVASGAAGASSNPGNLGNREKSLPRGGSRGGADAASAMPDDAEVAAIAASMLPADGREVIE